MIIIYSRHATQRMRERGISSPDIELALSKPDNYTVRKGKEGYKENR